MTCQGDAEASKRQVLGCDGVTADTRGLLQLVAAGNYRSAGNMACDNYLYLPLPTSNYL